MKKFFAVFLSLIVVFCIVGCTEAQNETQNKTSSANSTDSNVSSEDEGVKLKDGTIIYREGVISADALIEFKDESGSVLLNSTDIFKVSAKYLEYSGYVIQLDFNEDGTEKFKVATEKNKGKTISIYIDNKNVFSPVVQDVITDGKVIITNYEFTKEKILEIYDTLAE